MKVASFVLTASVCVLAACGGDKPAAEGDTLARDLQLAPADSALPPLADLPAADPQPTAQVTPPAATPRQARPPAPPPRTEAVAPAPAPPPPAPEPEPIRTRTLGTGAVFAATATDTITSRKNKAGETFTARIGTAVVGEDGMTVIPAGAVVAFDIVELAPAENKSDNTGKLVLRPTRVTINGESYPLTASVTNVEYVLKGRGVTAGDAAKVGVGAAAGAVAGRILGGKGKGAVVGGVVGAAAGTAVAVETADRDVVILPGAKITMTMRGTLSIPVGS